MTRYEELLQTLPQDPKTWLVTGVAGFIAARTAELLLEQGHEVVGIDNLNDYYDPRLKEWRLERLQERAESFTYLKLDVEDVEGLREAFSRNGHFDAVLNLAARAGVRYSLVYPRIYLSTNKDFQPVLLDVQVHIDH